MSTIEISNLVEALKEWETVLEDAKAEVENLKDAIKREMEARNVEHLEAGTHVVHWTAITSNRLDTGALKKAMPELAAQYTRAVTSRRFSVS